MRRFFVAALTLQAPLALAQATEPPDSGRLEKITVTAERRLTVLDDTPAAVTALNGTKLQEQGVTTLADVVTLAPNTTFTTGQNASQIFIRGIGNVFLLAGGDPGVAMYTDGAYVSDMTSINTALFDTQRVEVLRGPQGALYGRNATGGAVNIISARPTPAFQARVGALIGNYGRKESEGFFSGPLGGGTSVRLAYQVKEVDGYTDNLIAGQVGTPVVAGLRTTTGPDKLDDLSTRAVRLQSLSDFGGAGQLRVIAGFFRQDDAGPGTPALLEPIMNSSALFGVVPTTDPRKLKSQGSENRVDVDSLIATYELPVGRNTLHVTASRRKSDTLHDYDGDVTEAPVIWVNFTTKSTDKALDLHLASEDGAILTWLAGFTALRFDQSQDVRVSAQVPLGFLLPGAPLNVALPGGVDVMLGGKVRARSEAFYFDGRWNLSPRLALLAGVRHNRDRKEADEYLNIAAFGLAGTGSPSDEWKSTPGTLGLEFKPSQQTMTYAKVSSGFKSGAVNLGSLQPSLVKPERVTTVEAGMKTEFLDRRGTLNVAVFNSDYKDMQVSQVGTATVILANASKARIRGAEVELVMRPVPELTFNAAVGLMDPEYTDFVNADVRNNPTRFVNVKGNQLAQVSRSQVAVGAEYRASVSGYRITLASDYAWRSKFYFTEFNTDDAVQSGYGLLNFSGSVRPVTGRWKAYGYVRNATDKTAKTSLIISAPFLASGRQVTYTRPRELGAGVAIDF